MDFERLLKNLCDNIFEAQVKLGFEGRPMSLNYTFSTVRNLLGANLSDEELSCALGKFTEYARETLGNVVVRPIKDGFCITVPEKGTAYVHEHPEGGEFIREFIEALRRRCTLDEAFDVFRSYSDEVHIEEVHNDEFDYLVYFGGGIPDSYRYCITAEEEIDGSFHITYHRFIREDYDELGF